MVVLVVPPPGIVGCWNETTVWRGQRESRGWMDGWTSRGGVNPRGGHLSDEASVGGVPAREWAANGPVPPFV